MRIPSQHNKKDLPENFEGRKRSSHSENDDMVVPEPASPKLKKRRDYGEDEQGDYQISLQHCFISNQFLLFFSFHSNTDGVLLWQSVFSSGKPPVFVNCCLTVINQIAMPHASDSAAISTAVQS